MIIDAWKTKRTKGIITLFTQISFKEVKPSSYVTYRCDNPNCSHPNKVQAVTYGHLLKGEGKINLNYQVCRHCQNTGPNNPVYGVKKSDTFKLLARQRMNERTVILKEQYGTANYNQIKTLNGGDGQFIITFEGIANRVSSEGFVLKRLEGTNSFAKLTMSCSHGHNLTMVWNDWLSGSRCLECHLEDVFQSAVHNKRGYTEYKFKVDKYTRESYRLYKDIINPGQYRRGRISYHLDHKYSITEGFRDNIDPKIIGSHHNLQMLTYSENISKKNKCSISKEELLDAYFREDR